VDGWLVGLAVLLSGLPGLLCLLLLLGYLGSLVWLCSGLVDLMAGWICIAGMACWPAALDGWLDMLHGYMAGCDC
jgi:hypothetical protein